jgi:hypothetical protein
MVRRSRRCDFWEPGGHILVGERDVGTHLGSRSGPIVPACALLGTMQQASGTIMQHCSGGIYYTPGLPAPPHGILHHQTHHGHAAGRRCYAVSSLQHQSITQLKPRLGLRTTAPDNCSPCTTSWCAPLRPLPPPIVLAMQAAEPYTPPAELRCAATCLNTRLALVPQCHQPLHATTQVKPANKSRCTRMCMLHCACTLRTCSNIIAHMVH